MSDLQLTSLPLGTALLDKPNERPSAAYGTDITDVIPDDAYRALGHHPTGAFLRSMALGRDPRA
jgi:hypothetical protein